MLNIYWPYLNSQPQACFEGERLGLREGRPFAGNLLHQLIYRTGTRAQAGWDLSAIRAGISEDSRARALGRGEVHASLLGSYPGKVCRALERAEPLGAGRLLLLD